MALEAIRDVRALAPAAQIDLVVGSWNAAAGGRDTLASTASRRSMRAGWRARAKGSACQRLLRTRGAGGHAATTSRSTSSPTCGATSSRRRPARRARRAGRAAAAVRCSTWRSTTTHGAHHRQRAPAGRARVRTDAAGARAPAPGDPGYGDGRGRDRDPSAWRRTTARRRARQRRAGDQAVAPRTVRGGGGATGRCPRRRHRGHRRPGDRRARQPRCRPRSRRDW